MFGKDWWEKGESAPRRGAHGSGMTIVTAFVLFAQSKWASYSMMATIILVLAVVCTASADPVITISTSSYAQSDTILRTHFCLEDVNPDAVQLRVGVDENNKLVIVNSGSSEYCAGARVGAEITLIREERTPEPIIVDNVVVGTVDERVETSVLLTETTVLEMFESGQAPTDPETLERFLRTYGDPNQLLEAREEIEIQTDFVVLEDPIGIWRMVEDCSWVSTNKTLGQIIREGLLPEDPAKQDDLLSHFDVYGHPWEVIDAEQALLQMGYIEMVQIAHNLTDGEIPEKIVKDNDGDRAVKIKVSVCITLTGKVPGFAEASVTACVEFEGTLEEYEELRAQLVARAREIARQLLQEFLDELQEDDDEMKWWQRLIMVHPGFPG